jgi:ketosteroid isomerase-like protein
LSNAYRPLQKILICNVFALPTVAQQTNAPDPKLHEEFIAGDKKFDDGFINGDAAALAAFYAKDAVIIPHDGPPIYGREAIQKHFVDMFKKIHFIKHISKPEEYAPHVMGTAGNEVWGTGEFDQTFQFENGNPMRIKGHLFFILVRDGDALKIKGDTFNFSGPAVPAETK